MMMTDDNNMLDTYINLDITGNIEPLFSYFIPADLYT